MSRARGAESGGRRRPGLVALGLAGVLIVAPAPARAGSRKEAAEWPPISEAEKTLAAPPQDPGAGAVILSNTRDGRIVQDGKYLHNILDYHWRLKVLTERGKEHAEVHIPSYKTSRVSDIEARTVKPDGTVVPVTPDQIFEKVVRETGNARLTEFVFHFPATEPGAILEYRYTRRSDTLLFIPPWYFAGGEFTKYSRMSQAVPEGARYRTLCNLCPNPEPESSDWKEGKTRGRRFTVEMRDVPAFRGGRLMPPLADASPRVEMVLTGWMEVMWNELGRTGELFTDWPSVAKFAHFRYQKVYKVDEVAIGKVVAGWTAGIDDMAGKMKAIYRHVQTDFRYLPYDEVIAASRSVADLLKDRTADNEEKAVLLVAALRAIGVPAEVSLVCGRDHGTFIPAFSTLSQFTHAIVSLPRPDGTRTWLDPTATEAPFGVLPARDAGASALVIQEDGAALATLPDADPSGGTRYAVTVRPRPDGASDVEVAAEFRGDDAMEMREALVPAAESARADYLKEWVEARHPGAALRSQTVQDLDAVDRPLRVGLTLEAADLVTRAGEVELVRGCVLGCETSNPVSGEPRLYPFYVDRAENLEQTVTVVPPAGMKLAQTPPPARAASALGSLTFSCAAQPDGSVRCVRRYTVPAGRWPAGEQDGIRTMFDAVVRADQAAVALQTQGAGNPGGGR